MFTDIANEFQNITKFELLQYFIDYRDFLQDDYAQLGIESHNFVRDNFCSNELSARILHRKRELLDMIGE